MTDLRALLGDKWTDTILTAVLPDLLAAAWDEGHETPWQRERDDCRCFAWSSSECGCGRYGTGRLITPNPYRAAHAAAHSAPQTEDASQCGPDAARPADGIVSVAHYGTEGGER